MSRKKGGCVMKKNTRMVIGLAAVMVIAVVCAGIYTRNSAVRRDAETRLANASGISETQQKAAGIDAQTIRNSMALALQNGAGQSHNTKDAYADKASLLQTVTGAASSSAGGSMSRPSESDFQWFWDRGTNRPAGATTISGSALSGSWKAMTFVEADAGDVAYYSLFNTTVAVNGSSSSMKADWYASYCFWLDTGEDYYWLDESSDADTKYGGSYFGEQNTLVVWDDSNSFMFINTDMINGFMISDWYQYNGMQYATGCMFNSDDECIGTVAMVRDAGAPAQQVQTVTANGKPKTEDFMYTWWEEGADWPDKVGILLGIQNGQLTFAVYTAHDWPGEEQISSYSLKGNVLTIETKYNGTVYVEWKDERHIEISVGGLKKKFVREDDESVKLKDFIGIWKWVVGDNYGISVIAYADGKVYYTDINADYHDYYDVTVMDDYTISTDDMLTLDSADFKGGVVYCFKDGPTHMSTRNGAGAVTDYELISRVNLAQLQPKHGSGVNFNQKPTGTLPTGTITMPFHVE